MNNSAKEYCKVRQPSRFQMEFKQECLDDCLPDDHKARRIWQYVQSLETDPCYCKIKSMIGGSGRPVTSPEVLLSLWLLALTEGISSGRAIVRLAYAHDAYRWIRGGVDVNRTTLCDFRTLDSAIFHDLLTSSLAVMIRANVLSPEDIAQDGSKLQAAAGFHSYRGEQTLEELLAVSSKYVQEVENLTPKDLEGVEAGKLAARTRAVTEKKERIEKALKELETHQNIIKENKGGKSQKDLKKALDNSRASYVDPSARKMKMGDGGFRLAHNVQFATGADSRVIIGVLVTNTQDPGTLAPVMKQVSTRIEKLGLQFPENWIADCAYSGRDDLTQAGALFPGCKVIAPPKRINTENAKVPKRGDTEPVQKWRKHLDTDEFKEAYKKRCSASEFSNMTTKERGFERLRVRGTEKVLSQSLLYAIMHNMMRFWDLSGSTLS